MPGLYLYAIADAALARRARGIFGEPLRSLDLGGVYAIVGRAAGPPRASIARLRAQDRALRQMARTGATVLPVRFGAFRPGRPALESALAPRRAAFRRALRRVRGCVQMSVRLLPAGQARTPPPRTSGAAYLRHLASAARARASHPELRRLRRASKGLVKAERVEWHDGPAPAASVYHLVPRARQQEYRAAVAALAAAMEASGRGRLLVSGPWLPFAFAEDVT